MIDDKHSTFYKTRVTHVNIPKKSFNTAERTRELTGYTSQKIQQISELGSPLLFEIKHEKIEIDDENLQLDLLWNKHALLQSDGEERDSMRLECNRKCKETEVGDSNRRKRDSEHGKRDSKRKKRKNKRKEITSKRGERDSKLGERSECAESDNDRRDRDNKCGEKESSIVETGVAEKSGQRKKGASRHKKVKQSTETPKIREAQMTSKENANNTSTNNVLKEFKENKYDFEYTINKTEVDENTYSNEMKKVGRKKEKQQFVCDICETKFTLNNNLQRHITRIHHKVKPKTKLYECNQCGKQFNNRYCITRHFKTHSRERPFPCNHCGREFSQKPNLTRHIRVHTGEKPYECTYCEKTFAQKGDLTLHLRCHTGERPYACSFCYHKFSQKGVLVKHVKNFHKIRRTIS